MPKDTPAKATGSRLAAPRAATPPTGRRSSARLASRSASPATSTDGDGDVVMSDAPEALVPEAPAVPVVQVTLDVPVAQDALAGPAADAPAAGGATEVDNCAICLLDLERRGGRPIINPGCGHELHVSCFERLLRAKHGATCPTCRRPLAAHISGPSPGPNAPSAAILHNVISGPPRNLASRTINQSLPPPATSNSMAMAPVGAPANYSPGGWRARTQSFHSLPAMPDPSRDDPIDQVARAAAAAYDYSRIVTLKIDAETDPVPAGACKVNAMVSLRASADPNEDEDRNPADLVVVVDISGSMAGDKILRVRDTLLHIASALSESDRLSIVLFNDNARVLCQLTKLTATGVQRISELVGNIEASGGTSIASGLGLALSILEGRTARNKTAAVLLLSDGQDSYYHGSAGYDGLKSRAETLGCPVYTFGIGSDHDANCLASLATHGGSFSYVDVAEVMREAFAGAVGALKGVAVRGCKLEIEAVGGARIAGVLSGYPAERPSAATLAVRFVDVYYEEERQIVVELELPEGAPGIKAVLEARASFTVLDTSTDGQAIADALQVSRVAELPPSPARNLHVLKHRMRIGAADATARALRLADEEHDLVRAREILKGAKAEVLAALALCGPAPAAGSSSAPTSGDPEVRRFLEALIQDIDKSLEKLASDRSLDSGGRAYLQSFSKSNAEQRSTMVTPALSTPSGYVSKKSEQYSSRSKDLS